MKQILATLVYLKKENQTLMLLRNKKEKDIHKNKWNGLGGKLEFGESPLECAIREVKEESGLEITSAEFLGFISFPSFDGENDWQVFIYRAFQFKGEIQECPEGELHWIDDEKLLDLNLWEGDRLFLPKVLKGENFQGKFTYLEGKLKEYCFYKQPKPLLKSEFVKP